MITGSILITGGSGTLGRAILRQATRDKWAAAFTIVARSESRLAALKHRYPQIRTVIADVRDAEAMVKVVAGHDTVIHAAAMKRIPECEAQPGECYQTNVQGSLNVARACVLGQVKTAVCISTDKACLAATVYGASKLMMEGIWRSQPEGHTRFTGVRYGNVVASNGSVLQLWAEQARNGQALTLTDADMTRFWMSPTEAVKIIEDAWQRGTHGVIFVPRIGACSVRGLAQTLYPDHAIEVTGLRSTEKLHEDLIHEYEAATKGIDTYRLVRDGELGHSYTSENAPTLKVDAFNAMVADAKDLE